MASTLSVIECNVEATQVTIVFSDDVDQTSAANSTSATNPANYTIFDPAAGYGTTGTGLPNPTDVSALDSRTILLSGLAFNPGDIVLVGISNIALASNPGVSALITSPISFARQVPPAPGDTTATLTRDVEDAVAYPILTEEIGYRPSPVGLPTGGGSMGGGGGKSSLGQVALQAVTDVLGWKANNADPKGFIGALTQAFNLTEVEGHVESTWVPRTYAVQTDLGGGITGAQASLYTRAKDALDQSLNLLDGLYPLDPDADPEYVKALREMARSQMNEIVKEFGAVGLPSILRIDTYFSILLGQNPAEIANGSGTVQFDPDQIGGTLGELRDLYGIYFVNNPFNNSVADEEDITNFRVISDYMTSLMQSWIANRNFFFLAPDQQAFFGTQLVLISRQFNVIAETVNEVRFALDSVFIGPSERQTLLLEFADSNLSPMFLEDVLDEVDKFVTEEGPRLLRDGGKISVTNNILPVVQSLLNMVEEAHDPTNINELPDGFRTARVRNSLDDLDDQLQGLINLTEQVEQQVPPSLEKLVLAGVSAPIENHDGSYTFSLLGNNITVDAEVLVSSSVPMALAAEDITFYSAQRVDVRVHPRSLGLEHGHHHVTVTNRNGDSSTLMNALQYDGIRKCLTRGANPVAQSGTGTLRRKESRAAGKKGRHSRKAGRRYPVAIKMGGKVIPASPAGPKSAPRAPAPPAATPDVRYQNLSQQMDVHTRRITVIEDRMVEIHTSLAAKLEELSKKFDAQTVRPKPRGKK